MPHKMTMTFLQKIFITIITILISSATFAQCEGLKGNSEGMENWKDNYRDYFGVDSTFQFIKADSILIFYFSNTQNETNYGMPCCYYLADKYAQTELADYLNVLYKSLEKIDSANFVKAQQAWQTYYESEWEFLRHAFIAYANLSKYGQGREVMIETMSRKYQMIKDRILMIKSYIETASTQ
jgi:hypothetical protein